MTGPDAFYIFGDRDGSPSPLRLREHRMTSKGGTSTITIVVDTKDHYAAAHAMEQLDGVRKTQAKLTPPRSR